MTNNTEGFGVAGATTRRFARTMDQAFPRGVDYGCAIERPDKSNEGIELVVFALIAGIGGAALLVHFLSK